MAKYKQYSLKQLSEIANTSDSKKEFLQRIGYANYDFRVVKDIIKYYKRNLRKVPDVLLYDSKNNPAKTFKRINYKNGCSVCHKTEWLGEKIPLTLVYIDGDKSNTTDENLRLVCSNCFRTFKKTNESLIENSGQSKDIFKDFSKQTIEDAVKISKNYSEVLLNLGIKNWKTNDLYALIVYCHEEDIPVEWENKDKSKLAKRIKNLENESVRYVYLTNKLFDNYRCCKCGAGPVNDDGKFLPLCLYHKDGDRTNNRLDNLDLICPNCADIERRHKSYNSLKVSAEDDNIF